MKDNELLEIWKSNDQKLDQLLSLNQEFIHRMTKDRLKNTIERMHKPKRLALLVGLPYTLLLYAITLIAFKADGLFVVIGFGSISLIMTIIIIAYFYHIYLINQISNTQEIITAQRKLAKLKLSSFNITRLAIIQLPFWSICWMSLDALKNSPFLYGGVNLLVFLGLAYLSFWIYKNINIKNTESKISQLFLSGVEWEPILKSSEILDQLKEYETSL